MRENVLVFGEEDARDVEARFQLFNSAVERSRHLEHLVETLGFANERTCTMKDKFLNKRLLFKSVNKALKIHLIWKVRKRLTSERLGWSMLPPLSDKMLFLFKRVSLW